jgi:membrane-bound ClpP family serine protease
LALVTDPVRATRRRVAGHVKTAKRVGYLLFLASIVCVVVGLTGTFSGAIAASAIVCLVVGSVVLAPAIILGYAVNAAERDDRRRGL